MLWLFAVWCHRNMAVLCNSQVWLHDLRTFSVILSRISVIRLANTLRTIREPTEIVQLQHDEWLPMSSQMSVRWLSKWYQNRRQHQHEWSLDWDSTPWSDTCRRRAHLHLLLLSSWYFVDLEWDFQSPIHRLSEYSTQTGISWYTCGVAHNRVVRLNSTRGFNPFGNQLQDKIFMVEHNLATFLEPRNFNRILSHLYWSVSTCTVWHLDVIRDQIRIDEGLRWCLLYRSEVLWPEWRPVDRRDLGHPRRLDFTASNSWKLFDSWAKTW